MNVNKNQVSVFGYILLLIQLLCLLKTTERTQQKTCNRNCVTKL